MSATLSPQDQTDLFGSTQTPLWQRIHARWIIEDGDHKGRRCILKSSFDTDAGERFGRVILEDTNEEVVLPVMAFKLLMDTVIQPGVTTFTVRRPSLYDPPPRLAPSAVSAPSTPASVQNAA